MTSVVVVVGVVPDAIPPLPDGTEDIPINNCAMGICALAMTGLLLLLLLLVVPSVWCRFVTSVVSFSDMTPHRLRLLLVLLVAVVVVSVIVEGVSFI